MSELDVWNRKGCFFGMNAAPPKPENGVMPEYMWNLLTRCWQEPEERINIQTVLSVLRPINPPRIESDHPDSTAELVDAVDRADLDAVTSLIRKGRIDINAAHNGWNALQSACLSGRKLIAKTLLLNGAYASAINRTREDKANALHIAAGEGHSEIVELLLEWHMDIESKDGFECTPLHFASEHGHVAAIQILLHFGAKTNAMDIYNLTPLQRAVRKGQAEAVRILVQFDDKDLTISRCANGYSLLHLVCESGHTNVIDTLFSLDIINRDINQTTEDEEKHTLLHVAILFGRVEMATYLLDKGAGLEVKNAMGQTALHLAAGAPEIPSAALTRLLIERGADVFALDNKKQTPEFLAAKSGYDESRRLLQERSGKKNGEL
jgi:ankyrin repeat protein